MKPTTPDRQRLQAQLKDIAQAYDKRTGEVTRARARRETVEAVTLRLKGPPPAKVELFDYRLAARTQFSKYLADQIEKQMATFFMTHVHDDAVDASKYLVYGTAAKKGGRNLSITELLTS